MWSPYGVLLGQFIFPVFRGGVHVVQMEQLESSWTPHGLHMESVGEGKVLRPLGVGGLIKNSKNGSDQRGERVECQSYQSDIRLIPQCPPLWNTT